MSSRATAPVPWVAMLLAACSPCKPSPGPPPGSCTNDSNCPAGDACLAGTCQSFTQLLQNLSAVVTPPLAGNLAPQQYQPIDGTQSSLTLTLTAPQLWNLALPIPPTCTRDEALPMTLRFTLPADRPPIIPLLDWTFTFTTDAAGNVHGALPAGAGEQFDEWITPATPCMAPISLTDNSTPGFAAVPVFPDPSEMLTVVGAISSPGANGTFGGAAVTLMGALPGILGVPISSTVTTIEAGAGTIGFVLPVSITNVTPSSGGCAPQPVEESCDGGSCPVLGNCAVFTLEIGPSATNHALPTVDFPITARYASPPDGGPAGPILSLMGEDGLGVQLPLAPPQLVNVSGTVVEPGETQLSNAEVTLSCVQADGGPLCPQGYSYQLSTVTGGFGVSAGSFTLQAPPNGSYTLTATPPDGLGLAPFSTTVQVGGSDAGVSNLVLTLPSGDLLSGTVVDSNGAPVSGGEVQVTSLATGVLVGVTAIQSDGTFQLTLPPAQYMMVVHPSDSTGLPDRAEPESLQGDLKLGNFSLYPGARLSGGVFALPLDGTAFPVGQASLQFFFVTDTQAFGTVALPIASGITDAQGHFSVAVPSSTAPQDAGSQ